VQCTEDGRLWGGRSKPDCKEKEKSPGSTERGSKAIQFCCVSPGQSVGLGQIVGNPEEASGIKRYTNSSGAR